jgi:hypothetical protein
VNTWDVVAANNNAAPPDGWPENMNYSAVNNSAREMMSAIKELWADLNGSLVGGGSVNAYTVTLNANYAAYYTGMLFACSINNNNTGASTMNVNGIGAKNIVHDQTGNALTASSLISGQIYAFRYDGANLRLLGVPPYGELPQNIQAGNYTLGIADRGTHIFHNNGAGAGDTYTIPANASVPFPIGSVVTFINNDAAAVSIAITTDTLILAGTGSVGTRSLAQNGIATAVKFLSNAWLISGTGLS